jgi:tRNA (guanine-N7-)-methyltransferase
MEKQNAFVSRLYGRRKGRPLNARKSALLRDLLPAVQIALPSPPPLEGGVRGGVCKFLDLSVLFGGKLQSFNIEVGFGGGEHLAAQATQNPETGFIGCEPFVNGVASLLNHIDTKKLTNIRIFPDDARLLMDVLPDACLDRCFVLYPDPWPKKRHVERRFINPENLDRLARILKLGGDVRLATDVSSLADWMRENCVAHPSFSCAYDGAAPPAGWVVTRYEQKGIAAGRSPVYLVYRRKGR